MTEKEALAFVEQIRDICQRKGLWLKVETNNKPKLKDIVLTISIKIK